MSIMHKFISSISLIFLCLLLAVGKLTAQTSYNLSFKNPQVKASTLQLYVDIMISFNEAGKLGSSNLMIQFDPSVVKNPQLHSLNISKVPTYQQATFDLQSEKSVSLNIELLSNGSGELIGKAGNEYLLARISFDLVSTNNTVDLAWYESGSRGTVVFSDDPSFKQLTPMSLESLSLTPSNIPAEDLVLTGLQVGLHAQLAWEDMPPTDALSFEIERSMDGQLFEKIDLLDRDQSQGSSRIYNYIDEGVVNLFEGKVFYRVRKKGVDASLTMSNTVELSLEMANALSLQTYPNPVKDEVKIQWMDLGGKASIHLLDARGKRIKSVQTNEGQYRLSWDLSKLSRGIYMIEYQNLETKELRTSTRIQVE